MARVGLFLTKPKPPNQNPLLQRPCRQISLTARLHGTLAILGRHPWPNQAHLLSPSATGDAVVYATGTLQSTPPDQSTAAKHKKIYPERPEPPRDSPRLAVRKRNRRITRLEHADDDVRGRLAGRDSVGGAASHGPSADNHRRGDKRDITIHVHAQVAVPVQCTCTRTHAYENESVWAQQPGNNPTGCFGSASKFLPAISPAPPSPAQIASKELNRETRTSCTRRHP